MTHVLGGEGFVVADALHGDGALRHELCLGGVDGLAGARPVDGGHDDFALPDAELLELHGSHVVASRAFGFGVGLLRGGEVGEGNANGEALAALHDWDQGVNLASEELEVGVVVGGHVVGQLGWRLADVG